MVTEYTGELRGRRSEPVQPRHQMVTLPTNDDHAVVKMTQRPCNREYFASLQVPSPEKFELISLVQERREREMKKRNWCIASNQEQLEKGNLESQVDQRQRVLKYDVSMGLSTRWLDAVREAYYQKWTKVLSRDDLEALKQGEQSEIFLDSHDGDWNMKIRSTRARYHWKKVGLIARRACRDENSGGEEFKDEMNDWSSRNREKKESRETLKCLERRRTAKVLDLRYFLELIDIRHRYGSNLRVYHEEWKRCDTMENFFFWLDHGEGRYVTCKVCPRDRIEREEIRYLNKEERRKYRVTIDKYGNLCWAKNGNRIDTTEDYSDSVDGIVPVSNLKPNSTFSASRVPSKISRHVDNTVPAIGISEPPTSHLPTDGAEYRAAAYATSQMYGVRCMRNVRHVSKATILDKLLRSSVQKNTWIFVMDSRFRLYIGIKRSGDFQHSSFLYGSRLSVAGGIKVKDGKVRELNPLSGHYRTPLSNFRVFIQDLAEAGVDLSQSSISNSCAVLVGIETFKLARFMTKQYLDLIKQKNRSLCQKRKHN